MAYPTGNRHEIDPTHHGVADEVVAAVVEAELLQELRQGLFFAFQTRSPASRTFARGFVAKGNLLAVRANTARRRPRQQP